MFAFIYGVHGVIAALLWTLGWVYENQRTAYLKGVGCVVYMFLWCTAYPYILLMLFDHAVLEDDWILFIAMSLLIIIGLSAQVCLCRDVSVFNKLLGSKSNSKSLNQALRVEVVE